MMDELFLPIRGYEGLYEISNLGNVKSLGMGKSNSSLIEKIKRPTIRRGYYLIDLFKNAKRKTFSVHRLVAVAFIPNHQNLPQINHKDFNKLNNDFKNLEWCDNRYNMSHYCKSKKTTSRYTGVSLNKILNKWVAQARVNGRNRYLGLFDNEIDAAIIYEDTIKAR